MIWRGMYEMCVMRRFSCLERTGFGFGVLLSCFVFFFFANLANFLQTNYKVQICCKYLANHNLFVGVVRFRRLVKYFIVLTCLQSFRGLQTRFARWINLQARFVRSKFARYGKFARSGKFVKFAKSICKLGLWGLQGLQFAEAKDTYLGGDVNLP